MTAEQITPAQEKKKPTKFKTAAGSVYEYLPDGRTRRFKTAANKEQKPQDTIVFIPPWDLVKKGAVKKYPEIFLGVENEVQFEALLLTYVHTPGYTIRITDGTGKELYTNSQITSADKVWIFCVDKNNPKESFYLPVSKEPKIGYVTYDTSKYVGDDGQTYRDKHIGNKVTEIEYAN